MSCAPKIAFLVWPFLELVTLNDLVLEYAHRKLRMFEASQTRSMFFIDSFTFDTAVVCGKTKYVNLSNILTLT